MPKYFRAILLVTLVISTLIIPLLGCSNIYYSDDFLPATHNGDFSFRVNNVNYILINEAGAVVVK